MMNQDQKKILIVTFSPSGCCADLAEDSQAVLKHDQHRVLLCDITDPADREIILEQSISADILLLICPVYHRRIPPVIEDFFKKFKVKADRALLILGYGSCGVGSAPAQARKMLAKRRIPLYRVMKYPTEHAYSFAVKKEQRIEDQFGGLVFFLQTSVMEQSEKLPELYAENDPLRFLPTKWRVRLGAGLPQTDMNRCTLCGKCAELCPSGALDSDNTTVDASKCMRCGECVRVCAERAKSMRVSPMMKLSMKSAFGKPACPLELSERSK